MKICNLVRAVGCAIACFCSLGVTAAFAGDKPALMFGDEDEAFDGPYFGVDLSVQNIIAGSLIDGVDILTEGNKFVTSFSGGFRKQFGRFVIGVEGGYGLFDGDLQFSDPARQLEIDYEGNSQTHLGGIIGYVFGSQRDALVLGYLSEVSRSFDVSILSDGQSFAQQDKQGILRFGGGVEKRLGGAFHGRLTAGASRASFDAVTNIDPGTEIEGGATLLIQF